MRWLTVTIDSARLTDVLQTIVGSGHFDVWHVINPATPADSEMPCIFRLRVKERAPADTEAIRTKITATPGVIDAAIV